MLAWRCLWCVVLMGCYASHTSDAETAAEDGGVDAAIGEDAAPSRPDAGCLEEGCAIVEAALGSHHTCALRRDGSVTCCGSNAQVQLGREGVARSSTPLRVDGLPPVVGLVGDLGYTCGVTAGDESWCWGFGVPLFAESARPIADWAPVSGVAALGQGIAHACVATATGEVVCWGFRNGDGQLGTGTRDVPTGPQPVEVPGAVTQLSLGAWHACARTALGELWCWGRNQEGQIGDGRGGNGEPEDDALSPALVLDDVAQVATGHAFTCAVHDDGRLSCWGDNSVGQIGHGGDERFVPAPVPVDVPAGVVVTDVRASADGSHACARTRSGRVLCWGANGAPGSLGHGGVEPSLGVPVVVEGIDDAVSIAVGGAHGCATRPGGELWCWGLNDDGQLCDGTRTSQPVPVKALLP